MILERYVLLWCVGAVVVVYVVVGKLGMNVCPRDEFCGVEVFE